MIDLAEFLLARIADEKAAWSGGLDLATRPEFAKLSRYMLAECEAKRRIVDEFVANTRNNTWELEAPGLERALQALALPYADHEDYDEEWRL